MRTSSPRCALSSAKPRSPASPPAALRVAREPVADARKHLQRDRRHRLDQAAKGTVGQDERAYGGRRGHRRGARDLGEKRDLAEPVAACELGDLSPSPGDAHGAVDEDEELAARTSFSYEQIALAQIDLVGRRGDLAQLGLRAARRRAEPSSVGRSWRSSPSTSRCYWLRACAARTRELTRSSRSGACASRALETYCPVGVKPRPGR